MAWSDLREGPKHVCKVIGMHLDEHGRAFPGQARLARMCSMSPRTVRKHVKAAELAGWVVRKRRFTDQGRRTSDEYTATYPAGYSPPEESAGGDDDYRKIPTGLPEDFDRPYRKNLPGNLSVEVNKNIPDQSEEENGETSTTHLGEADRADRGDLSRCIRDKLRLRVEEVFHRSFKTDMQDADRLHLEGTPYGEQLIAVEGFCSLREKRVLGVLVGPGEAASYAAVLRTDTGGYESVWERSLTEGYKLLEVRDREDGAAA